MLHPKLVNSNYIETVKRYSINNDGSLDSSATLPIASGDASYNLLWFYGTSSLDNTLISDYDLSNGLEFQWSMPALAPILPYINVYAPKYPSVTLDILINNNDQFDITAASAAAEAATLKFLELSAAQNKKVIISGFSQGTMLVSYLINKGKIGRAHV